MVKKLVIFSKYKYLHVKIASLANVKSCVTVYRSNSLMFVPAQSQWIGTLLSEQARSMISVVMSIPAGRWRAERDPQRHTIADLRREKLSLHLIQCIVLL